MKIQLETENLVIFQSALYQTTTTLVKTNQYVLLVDPNWLPEEIQLIKTYVEKIKGELPLYLLFTHSDFDHIIAAGAFESDGIIASKAFAMEMDREKILNDIKKFDSQYYVSRDYPIIYPEATIVIKEDNQQVTIEDEAIVLYLAPGHTKDGIFAYIPSQQILIVGDYLSNVEFPFIEHLEHYKETLNKASKLIDGKPINYLIPGHGQFTSNKEEMKRRVQDSWQYINDLQNNVPQEALLKERYPFYDGMQELHHMNQLLVNKKEQMRL